MLVVNKLVPCATIMTGLKIAPMRRFLGLLGVDSQNPDYMKISAIDLLVKLTDDLFQEEMTKVREQMMQYEVFDCGMAFPFVD